jgi:uncharacterized protein YoxC
VKDLLELFLNDPLKAIALGAIALVTYFIIRFERRLSKRFDTFETAMGHWESRVKSHYADVKKVLQSHAANLVKAVEAINGDLTGIQRNTHELKLGVNEKVEELKNTVAEVEREARAIAHAFYLASDKLEHKFGTIVEVKGKTDEAFGKITHVEKEHENFKVSVDTRFRAVAKIIADTRKGLKKTGNGTGGDQDK